MSGSVLAQFYMQRDNGLLKTNATQTARTSKKKLLSRHSLQYNTAAIFYKKYINFKEKSMLPHVLFRWDKTFDKQLLY